MTILSVCQQVAAVIGLKIPDAVMGSTEREHIELAALANEMAERIAFDNNYDWSILKRVGALIDNGSAQTAFDLPSDYRRMLKKASLYPNWAPFSSFTHYPDTDQWLAMQSQSFQPLLGGWTIIGNQIHVMKALTADQSIRFYYIHNQIVKSPVNGAQTAFLADEDSYVLNERLLKLGMIWQWKANKGQQYAEDLSNYEDALSSLVGADKGSNIITIGARRYPNVDIAFPGVITP